MLEFNDERIALPSACAGKIRLFLTFEAYKLCRREKGERIWDSWYEA